MRGKRIIPMLVSVVMLVTSVFSGFCFAEPSEKKDWTAYWIWNTQTPATLPEEGDVWMNFRKEFTLDSLPQQRVVADIAAESKYFLYINGELAVFDGGLKRGLDRKSGYYDKVDITDYLTENSAKQTINNIILKMEQSRKLRMKAN